MKGRRSNAALVGDRSLHVDRVGIDERRAGPPCVRHRHRIGHAAAVRHVLVDLHTGNQRRFVVHHPGGVRAAVMAQVVERADVERIWTLGAGGRVARIELEDIDASVRAVRGDHRRSRQQLRRDDAGGIDDGDRDVDRRRPTVGERARVGRRVGGHGDGRRLVVEVHALRGAHVGMTGRAGRGDRELERRGPVRRRRRARQGKRVRAPAPGRPGVRARAGLAADPQADAGRVHSRLIRDGGGHGQRRARGVEEGAPLRIGVVGGRGDGDARDRGGVGGHANALGRVASGASGAVAVARARPEARGAARSQGDADDEDVGGAHGVRRRRSGPRRPRAGRPRR